MTTTRAALGKLGAFSLAPLVVSLASIGSIPLIVASAGPSVLVSIAVGQAVGDIARAFVSWSWNTVGLTKVSNQTPEQRIIYYFHSIIPRLLLTVPALLVVTGFVMVWPIEHRLISWLAAVSGVIFGLNGTWLFIGAREPKLLILCNSIPRASLIVIGALMTFVMGSGIFFPIALILGNLAAALGPTLVAERRRRAWGVEVPQQGLTEMLAQIRKNYPVFAVDFIMASRMSAPVMLAPVVFPAVAPMVAIAERILRWVNTGLTPAMQFIQTGIPNSAGSARTQAIGGIKKAWTYGIPIGLVIWVTTPILSTVLSAGKINLDSVDATLMGVISGAIFTGTVIGNGSLVHLGCVHRVAKVALVGLAILVLCSLTLAHVVPERSVLLSFAISEVLICLTLTCIALRVSEKAAEHEGARRA